MKKRSLFILTAIAAILSTGNAGAAKKDGKTPCDRCQKIEYSKPVMVQAGTDSCAIKLPVTIKYGSMRRGEKLDINFILFDVIEDRSDEFGGVTFSTGNRYDKDKREKRRHGEIVGEPDFESKFGRRKPLEIVYSCTIPKEDRTLDATHIIIKQELSKGKQSCNYGSILIPLEVIK